MAYVKLQYENLKAFSLEVFEKMGYTPDEAAIITDVLLTADLYGIESHGMQRMVRYYKSIKNGRLHMGTKPEVVFETPLSAVIDNHDGTGQQHDVFGKCLSVGKYHRVAKATAVLNWVGHSYPHGDERHNGHENQGNPGGKPPPDGAEHEHAHREL